MESTILVMGGALLNICGGIMFVQQIIGTHDMSTRVKIKLIEYQELIDQHKIGAYIEPRTNPTKAWNYIYNHIERMDKLWGAAFFICGSYYY